VKAKEILENEAKNNSWAHAYLFVGKNDKLIGKLIDYIVEKKKCQKQDLSEIWPEDVAGKAGEIKIDDVRMLLHDVSLSPAGEARIAIIHNCERLNSSSGNILLKNLEEPPKRVIFILTANTDSVLTTIKSRCRVFNIESEIMSGYDKEDLDIFNKGFFSASKKFEEMAKEGRAKEFVSDIQNFLQEKLLLKKDIKIAEALKTTENFRKILNTNANPRLQLECLFLSLEEIVKKELN
jgi:DNA polymerase-3 subunit delta'